MRRSSTRSPKATRTTTCPAIATREPEHKLNEGSYLPGRDTRNVRHGKIKSSRMSISFDPLVAEWFTNRFPQPTEPQSLGWPQIRSGHDVLISAPTGSGKTLAAFLLSIDDLVRAARAGELSDRVDMIYVSPLKALSNDVQKNLETPLAEIAALAAERGVPLAPIQTALRTGDTLASERQKMLSRPPHILVTTPESLFILVTAEKSREM